MSSVSVDLGESAARAKQQHHQQQQQQHQQQQQQQHHAYNKSEAARPSQGQPRPGQAYDRAGKYGTYYEPQQHRPPTSNEYAGKRLEATFDVIKPRPHPSCPNLTYVVTLTVLDVVIIIIIVVVVFDFEFRTKML